MQPLLDHVILLLPHRDILDPPEWLTKLFTISPGGRHADGRTENRLVLFRDGTYLELIAFIDDAAEKRHGHWWDRAFGVVDYALTTITTIDKHTSAETEEKNDEQRTAGADDFDVDAINRRLAQTSTGISYDQPQAGGRLRPDGIELRWKVTFPAGVTRGGVPFWCHDVTPRVRRVPVDAANTTHPCGAVGMAGVRITTGSSADAARLRSATAAILDVPGGEGGAADGGTGAQQGRFELGVPQSVGGGARSPTIDLRRSTDGDAPGQELALSLVLQTPQAGVSDVRMDVEGGKVEILFAPVK